MVGQQLPQTNEKYYSVQYDPFYHHFTDLNTASVSNCFCPICDTVQILKFIYFVKLQTTCIDFRQVKTDEIFPSVTELPRTSECVLFLFFF